MTTPNDIQKVIDAQLCDSCELPWRRIGRVLGVDDGGRSEHYMPDYLVEESEKITAIISRAKPIAEQLRKLLDELDTATDYNPHLNEAALEIVDSIMETAYIQPVPLTEGGWVDAEKMKGGHRDSH